MLDESDLEVLVEDLQTVQTKWEAIGRALRLREETLEDIHTQYGHTKPGDGLREVLRLRLPTYWDRFVDALRSVGDDRLASKLKVKYGELSTTDSSPICIDTQTKTSVRFSYYEILHNPTTDMYLA